MIETYIIRLIDDLNDYNHNFKLSLPNLTFKIIF